MAAMASSIFDEDGLLLKYKYQTLATNMILGSMFAVLLLIFATQNGTRNLHTPYSTKLKQNPSELLATRENKSYLIFQIGFNKAGTSALRDFFSLNGINACHFDAFQLPLSQNMYAQQMKNKSVLAPFLRNNSMHFQYYGDFGVYIQQNQVEDILFLNTSYQEGQYRTWYELLTHQYPEYEKLFILNIRNVNNWIMIR